MMTNLELFQYSGEHPEPLIDPYYSRDRVVIPPTPKESNLLVECHARLIELITVFGYFVKQGKPREHAEVQALLDEVITILTSTEGINLSPFAQFFLVYNVAYASFVTYPLEVKREFVYEMLQLYLEKRHQLYLNHGYSNTTLQVLCDNYSHKRNSKSTIVKVCDILEPLGFVHGEEAPGKRAYFLPDRGDKALFKAFKQRTGLVMESAKNEQGKLPDMVFALDGHTFIVEMKNLKGSGGGQDKQLTEIINFIRYAEHDPNIHYITYLDGEYSNLLHGKKRSPKIQRQYEDILSCLTAHPGNYFLNTAGLQRLFAQLTSS